SVYSSLAPDHRFYNSESTSHVFWHTLYVGLISTDPELTSRYGYGEDTYSDMMGYIAALHYLRGRNESPPEFAEVVDGVININIIRDTGAYDRVIRKVFFQVVAEHPWLVLRSFLVGKPSDEVEILSHVAPLRDMRAYFEVLALGLAVSILAVLTGAGVQHGRQWLHWTIAVALVVICSWLPMLIVPSALVPDVIVFYLMLVLLITAYLPLVLVWGWVTATSSPRGNVLAQASVVRTPEIQNSGRKQEPTSVT